MNISCLWIHHVDGMYQVVAAFWPAGLAPRPVAKCNTRVHAEQRLATIAHQHNLEVIMMAPFPGLSTQIAISRGALHPAAEVIDLEAVG
ncbi:MAG: hypothetical protein V3U93_03455 [Alphaproteobacteria bacterium]